MSPYGAIDVPWPIMLGISSGFGHARLVNVLAKLYGDVYGVKIDPMNEVFSEELVKFPNDSICSKFNLTLLVDLKFVWYISFCNFLKYFQILVTVGAYMALYYAFNGWINKGDQAISEILSLFLKKLEKSE